MKTHEKKTLAVAMRVRDDLDCLKENIEYHTLVGVEHFFIYDHKSVIPLKDSLKEYKNVTVKSISNFNKFFTCADLKDCHDQNKDKFKWIAFIDVDEFLVMKDGNTDLREFLKPYEDYGGLCVWEKRFGSSGHKKKQKSVIQAYTYCTRWSGGNYKTILNTKFGCPSTNVHWSDYIKGKFGVDENFNKVITPPIVNKIKTSEKIQINHYQNRSEEDYAEKTKRWRDAGPESQRSKKNFMENMWNQTDKPANAVKETIIIEFLNKIKKNDKIE